MEELTHQLDKELWTFIVKDVSSEEEIIALLKKYQVERVLYNNFSKEYGINLPYIEEDIKLQKQRFNLFKEEIKNISTKFSQNNINVIQLKGVSLASDIYTLNPEVRKSKDIDIFVAPQDIIDSLDIIGKLGFKVMESGETVSSKLLQNCYDEIISRSIHLPEFQKAVFYNEKMYKIKMDCHVSLVHTLDNKVEMMNKIASRCEEQFIDDIKIKVLEIHDRILHLIVHFTKEFFRCYVRWNITGERVIEGNNRINLALLHDIALLIFKNKEKLDYNILHERAKELIALDELNFVLESLLKVYPSLSSVINKFAFYEDDQKYKIKRAGLFYPIATIFDNNIDLLKMDLNEISSYIIGSINKSIYLNADYNGNYSYNITRNHSNSIIRGCDISDNYNLEVIGNITIEYNNEGLSLKISSELVEKQKLVTVVIASSNKGKTLNSFINKFAIYLKENTFSNFYLMDISNGYYYLQLKSNVIKEGDIVTITIPWKIIDCSYDKDNVYLDIDFPEIHKDENDKKIPKYFINDVSKRGLGYTYPYTPYILKPIKFL